MSSSPKRGRREIRRKEPSSQTSSPMLPESGFRALVEHSPDIITRFDCEGRHLYVSPAIEVASGLSQDEFIGKTHRELGLPDDFCEMWEGVLRGVLASGEPAAVAFDYATPTGVRSFEARLVPEIGEDGRVEGITSVARDLTELRRVEAERERLIQELETELAERRATEARLATAEAHYRRLVGNSPYPIYALDAEGRLRELNAAALVALGYEADELMGRHFGEIVHSDDRAIAGTSFQRSMTKGGSETELRVVRKDGESRLLHLRAAAIVEDGRVIGTHGVARDITDERARDERMRLLATALEGLDKGVSIIDASGRFLYANSAHAKIYGYELDELHTLNARRLLPGADQGAELEALIGRLREGAVAGRFTRHRVDGSEITVGVVTGRMEESGRELFVTITRDATEELVREQHMRRAERLASMGTLLSGVAHELNNPLNAIANFAQLLLMEPRSGEDREALEIMQREADRAARIVCDLRTIARQTQDAPVQKQLLHLGDVVRHVLKLRRYTLDTHDIRVAESLEPPVPPVWGSRPELEQVVLNLVLNAEQAMAAHGRARKLTIRTAASRSRVTLQIADTGPGIPEAIAGRIFDPFFTTKAPGEGMGLGLSLVHTIVTAHGGEIRVSSTERGTTFTVDLPRARDREPAGGEPSTAIGVAERALRVLVVDDESAIRRSLQIYLERRGHRVELARNGAEAIARVNEADAPFDVILSDLRMPGLGGEQFLEHLQLRGGGLDRRVIFMTGDAASGDAARLLDATGNPALIKPVRLDQVARVVEEAERRLREASAS